MCEFAAVYGQDGPAWACSNGFQLASYEFQQPQEDGSTKPVACNEHAALIKACGGDRKGGSDCGIRICNQKYMFLTSSKMEDVKYVVLSRQGGGGACVALTGKALIVGVYNKTAMMSNNKTQNTGDCQKNVINVAKQLMEAGF